MTSLLFNVGRFLIGLYIGKSGVASGFGAAGSLIVVFVWVYYSAQIFLMGAEFTWVYARTFGSMKNLQDPAANPGPTSAPAGDRVSHVGERMPTAPVIQPPYRPASVAVTPSAGTGQSWLTGIAIGVGLGLGVRYLVSQLAGRKNWA